MRAPDYDESTSLLGEHFTMMLNIFDITDKQFIVFYEILQCTNLGVYVKRDFVEEIQDQFADGRPRELFRQHVKLANKGVTKYLDHWITYLEKYIARNNHKKRMVELLGACSGWLNMLKNERSKAG